MLTVRDLLKVKGEGVWAISPETSMLDALRFMTEKNVGALVVLEDGLLVGIISERDFVHQIAEKRQAQLDASIGEYMTTKVITVTPDQTIEDCMQLMTLKHIRHLPVMSKDQLIGLISIGDVVKGIISEQSSMINNLQDYILGTGYGQ
jgi:CBS domain-containing protein